MNAIKKLLLTPLAIAILSIAIFFSPIIKFECHCWYLKKIAKLSGSNPTYHFNLLDLNKPLPGWADRQINLDLEQFNTKYSDQDLKNILHKYANSNSLVLFKIKNHQLETYFLNKKFASERRFKVIRDICQYIAANKLINNVSFIICLDDFVNTKDFTVHNLPPIFTFARDNNHSLEKNMILFPDWMNLRSWPELTPRIELANKFYNWPNKQNKIYWRGTSGGGDKFRRQLVDFNKIQDTILDAKYTRDDGDLANYKIYKFVPPEKHLKYKYQLNVDGVRASWERLVWMLASNCVPLKQNSSHVQWFYLGLQPYIHYYPIDSSIDSLQWAYKYLENHPDQSYKIALNGQEFAKNNLAITDMMVYIINLLQQYKNRIYYEL